MSEGLQIGAGFRGGVWRSRTKRVALRATAGFDVTVDLVGRNLYEPRHRTLAYGFEQHVSTESRGTDERLRIEDRAIERSSDRRASRRRN